MQTQQLTDYWNIYEQQEEIIRKMFDLCDSYAAQNMNLSAKLKHLEQQRENSEAVESRTSTPKKKKQKKGQQK